MDKRATIADVAARAGVSRSAVSKVLRNAYGISEHMRTCVEQAMTALNYRPQIAARGLRGRTYTLGVVMPDMRNPFFPAILDGIWSVLHGTSYHPLFAIRDEEEGTESALVDMMLDRKLDGLIMVSPILEEPYLLRLAEVVPLVLIGRHERGARYDSVNNDDELGARLVVSHLVEQGHRKIAFFGFEQQVDGVLSPAVFRQRGYVAAMQAHGLDSHMQIHRTPELHSAEDDRQLAGSILASRMRPTAIFGWSDGPAIQVLAQAHHMGLGSPRELAVVGYDNSWLCGLPQIGLTSVDQDAHTMGATATRLVIERIEGRTAPIHHVTQPTLVVRPSSLTTTPPSA